MTRKEKIAKLQQIADQIALCQKCPLYIGTNPVSGEGNPEAQIMFIGEAPGERENAIKRPFVGRSGQLLDINLQQIGLKRSDVWIGNMIKHRPPNNRDPLPDELSACKGYLDQQIKIINPHFVVTLGRFAMEKFISGVYISKVHGTATPVVWENNHFMLFPMFHPAAALRDGNTMASFKADFIKLKQLLAPKQNIIMESKTDHKDPHQQLNLIQ